MTTTAATAATQQTARRWREPLGRAGITARGVLYLLLGILAIQFARGETSSDQVSQVGAFETLAEQPFGKFLLVAMIAGLIALCLWRLIQAFVGDPVEGDEAKDRVEYLGKAVIYGALVVTAIKVASEVWSGTSGSASSTTQQSGDAQNQQVAWSLFELPGGRLLVGILGVALIVIAVYQAYEHTVEAKFMERLAPPGTTAKGIEAIGRIGYAARSVVFAASGVFFIVSAVQYDPNQSKGISGTLAEFAQNSAGQIVLWGVAIGFALFGIFCFAEAVYRRSA